MKKQLSFVVYFEGDTIIEEELERRLRAVTRQVLEEYYINVFKKETKINSIRS
jgi:hypothetical protein